jgi:Protein of unknown function (DUF2442)
MIKIIEIKPLPAYKLHIKYNNGVEGDLDLSIMVGRGVFSNFNNINFFNNVWIGETGAPTWEGEIDIDVINSYLKITGKTFEQFLKEENN